jgi:hypothetical protein
MRPARGRDTGRRSVGCLRFASVFNAVVPAKAGTYNHHRECGSRLRGDDNRESEATTTQNTGMMKQTTTQEGTHP